ncbi:MAG: hypothetical protein GTO24_02840, partial [candidate division Zixibacteria bacterium]|nr:hypothetical protein [candidate division Zixibacteria bacterium]
MMKKRLASCLISIRVFSAVVLLVLFPAATFAASQTKTAGTVTDPSATWSDESGSGLTVDAGSSDNYQVSYNATGRDDLILTNFGFTDSEIPAYATITGIIVTREGHGTGNPAAREYRIGLTKNASDLVGDRKPDQALPKNESGEDAEGSVDVGSATDKWGTTWTPAEIKDTNFGVLISDNDASASPILFDQIQVTVHYALPLYRSVGTDGDPLASGASNGLNISGSTATFNTGLPNKIGVGDVIEYDYNNSGSVNKLAFIHGRISATQYTVKDKDGGDPTATTAEDNDWEIHRAYTSLENWQSGAENGNITEPAEDDVNPNKDLTSANTIMMVACYGDGEDTTGAYIDSWTTSADNYIKIFTPFWNTEVGTSQRHDGKWNDTSAYRISMKGDWIGVIGILERYVRIDGLQIDSDATYNNQSIGLKVDDGNSDAAAEIHISNSIFRMSTASEPSSQAFGIGIGNFVGTNSDYVFKVWNNIIYGYKANSGSAGICMYAGQNGTVYAYNNTCVGEGDGVTADGIAVYNNVLFYAKNNISIDFTDPYNGSFVAGPDSTNNLSDASDAPGDNPVNGEPTFVSKAGDNYHLDSGDTVAKDEGADLSSDTDHPFVSDIDMGARSGTWDIGADEEGVSGDPTAVTMISFTAKGNGSTVVVDWKTGEESDNFGFNLYRAQGPEGPFTKLNDGLIPARAFPMGGGVYTYEDTDTIPGELYYYRLEDVDV